MTMTIDTSGHIKIDGTDTGLGVSQQRKGTVLYRRDIPAGWRGIGSPKQDYEEVPLPHDRYSLSHPTPPDGHPGLTQFEIDVRRLLV